MSGWMDGWMDVCVLSTFVKSLLLLLQFLADSHQTWHTWSMCQYAKNCATDFRNFDIKIFDKFLKFYVWT